MLQNLCISNPKKQGEPGDYLSPRLRELLPLNSIGPTSLDQRANSTAAKIFAPATLNSLSESFRRPPSTARQALQELNSIHINLKEKTESGNTEEFEKRVTRALGKLKFDIEGTYSDLEKLRAQKRTLNLLRSMEDTILKSGTTLNSIVNPVYNQVRTDLDDLLKHEKIKALVTLEKCAAKYRGKQVRNYAFTTHQMFSLFHGKLLGVAAADIWNITRALSRELNEIMEDPCKYKGRNLQLKANEKAYPFYCFETDTTEELYLDFPFWLEVSPDAKFVDLFIIPQNQKSLGSGSFKEVSIAQCFRFKFSVDLVEKNLLSEESLKVKRTEKLQAPNTNRYFTYEREGTYFPMTLHEVLEGDCSSFVERGIGFHRQLKILAPLAQLPEPLKEPFPPVSGTTRFSESRLYYQQFYNSDLLKAANSKLVPLDFSENPNKLNFTYLHILNIFIEVGTTLFECHKHGGVHRDIKPSNILLEVTADGKNIKGYPADYDLFQIEGPASIPTYSCPYWDKLSNLGFATPFTDVYALAISLAEVTIPGFSRAETLSYNDEKNRTNILWEVTEKTLLENIPESSLLTFMAGKSPSLGLINKVIEHLSESVRTVNEPYKEKFQTCFEKISIVKGVLNLLADVIIANENIKSTYFVDKSSKWISVKKHKESDTQLHNAEEIALKLRLRKNALAYLKLMNELYSSSEEEYSKHPLYRALENPMQVQNPEISNNIINKEIDLITLSSNIQTLLGPLNHFERFNNAHDRRMAFKEAIKDIIRDKNNPDVILKKQCEQYLNKIVVIEETMAFVVQMHFENRTKIAEIMQMSMTMKTFVTRLKAIKESVFQPKDSEEKN